MNDVAPSGRSLRVGYLINSHSFIRREVLALERAGVHLQRVASRSRAGAESAA